MQDSGGATATGQVTLQIVHVNDAPVAQSSSFVGRENLTISGQLRATDVEGEALTFGLISTPRFGTLVLNPNGNFVYTPKVLWHGSDSFTFRAIDSARAAGTPVTISLTVLPVNGAPIAVTDTVKATEDQPLSIATATLTDNDKNGEAVGEVDALRIIGVSTPAGFSDKIVLDGANGLVVFTPKLNWNGTTNFFYTLEDSGRLRAITTVTVQVASVNDAPVALPAKMTVISGTLGELQLQGNDVEGDALSFALSGKPLNGGAVVVKVGDKWLLRYQSKTGFSGTDTLSFIARDSKLNSVTATVTITVRPSTSATPSAPSS